MGQSDRSDERDRLAEEWLTARHSWYIGDATSAEWEAAYAAVGMAWREGTTGSGPGGYVNA